MGRRLGCVKVSKWVRVKTDDFGTGRVDPKHLLFIVLIFKLILSVSRSYIISIIAQFYEEIGGFVYGKYTFGDF